MPRLTKIYTRKGDDGTTALGSRDRVPKDSLRVKAYGTVDELNSWLGLALAEGLSDPLPEVLSGIQNELFHLGAELSFPAADQDQTPIPKIESRHITRLESLIDRLNDTVGSLENFILPGGSRQAALLHIARTVCRRAERELVTLAGQEAIGAFALPYLNRLSDALFVMARYENFRRGVAEPLWDSHA